MKFAIMILVTIGLTSSLTFAEDKSPDIIAQILDANMGTVQGKTHSGRVCSVRGAILPSDGTPWLNIKVYNYIMILRYPNQRWQYDSETGHLKYTYNPNMVAHLQINTETLKIRSALLIKGETQFDECFLPEKDK